jgi:hypothetical protein
LQDGIQLARMVGWLVGAAHTEKWSLTATQRLPLAEKSHNSLA